jgi:hypothetical protein
MNTNINVPEGKKKYIIWFNRELDKGYKEEDLQGTIEFFHNNVKKFSQRDIFLWDGKDLENHIKENKMYSRRQFLKNKKNEDTEKIYENDDFLVVCPKNKESSTIYGKGTKWCISMKGANYFDQYRENHIFYFLIDKKSENKDKYSKIAIVLKKNDENKIENTEYYLSDDTKEDFDNLPSRIKEFLEED